MKIILSETKIQLTTETIDGFEDFKNKTLKIFPVVRQYWHVIEKSVVESSCKKILLNDLKMGIAVSLVDRVIFTDRMFNLPLDKFLFTLFHELAHQYQYKKYGREKMMELYTRSMSVAEGAEFMRSVEVVADEFAIRKLRELQNLGFISNTELPQGIYKNTPLSVFEETILFLKSKLKDKRVNSPDEISDVLHNWIKIENQKVSEHT